MSNQTLLKLFMKYKKYCECLDLKPTKESFLKWHHGQCSNVYDCDICFDRYQESKQKAVINHG